MAPGAEVVGLGSTESCDSTVSEFRSVGGTKGGIVLVATLSAASGKLDKRSAEAGVDAGGMGSGVIDAPKGLGLGGSGCGRSRERFIGTDVGRFKVVPEASVLAGGDRFGEGCLILPSWSTAGTATEL